MSVTVVTTTNAIEYFNKQLEVEETSREKLKMAAASEAILQISELSRLEADTTAQLAVFFYKS